MSDYVEDLVSVVTQAFNATRFIGETIESVQAQTHDNWEMIIVDDCSVDNMCELVERFAKEDSRIRLVKHSSNRGPAETRNTGSAMAIDG